MGLWRPGKYHQKPFVHLGFYSGEPLGDVIMGTKFEQKLLDSVVTFVVGCLFRPDLGKKQRLETIIILEKFTPDMWDYDTWEQATQSG